MSDKKTASVSLRMSEEEKSEFKKFAAAQSKSISEWFRALGHAALRRANAIAAKRE